jgi:hypothetical protein
MRPQLAEADVSPKREALASTGICFVQRYNRPLASLREQSLHSFEAMLNNAKIIAFVATTDAAKSRAFYEGVLGLAPTWEDEFAIVLDANGVELRIQKVQTLAPQPHTQLGWSVISLEEAVRALFAKVWCSSAIPLYSKVR